MTNQDCKCPFACAENAACIVMTTQLVKQAELIAVMLKKLEIICKVLKIISSKINGDYTPPNQRKSANERLVQAAINKYWEYVKNGTSERDSLAIACRAIEKAYGLGEYKSLESLRTAVYREINKNRHSLNELEDLFELN